MREIKSNYRIKFLPEERHIVVKDNWIHDGNVMAAFSTQYCQCKVIYFKVF